MISTLTSPSFVNRVQESWQAGYGVTQSSPVSGGPFTQAGFTLDMNFAAVPQQNLIWVTDQGLTVKTFNEIVTFTRASTGTYFDSAGVLQRATYNILPYSEQFDNAAWGKVGMTVTANAAAAPDNTVTGDRLIPDVVTGLPYTFQTITVVSGANYAWSVYLKAAGYSWVFLDAFDGANHRTWFDLSTGTIGTVEAGNTSTITDVGNGWYRCTIARSSGGVSTAYAVAIVSGNNALNITGNGVSGVFAWGAQLEQASAPGPYYATTTAANGAPRFDYNPSTPAPLGLLIEEQRTNLLVQSELASGWTLSAVTRTANATSAPDGTFTANLYTSTGADSSVAQLAVAVSASITYTFSIWLRADVATTINIFIVDTGGGAGNTGAVCNVTTQWTRFVVTRTTSVGTTSCTVQVGGANTFSTGEAVYVWGAQLEAGAFPTSYIPTTTAAATRAADVASVNTLSPWYNPVEGTLFVEASVLSESYNQGVLVDIGAVGAFGTTEYINRASSAWILSPNTAPINVSSAVATSSTAKIAAAIKANDSVISANGLIGSVDTTCAVPLAPTTLSIGKAGWSGGSNFLNGYIRRITYYPRRLSNNELQAITT